MLQLLILGISLHFSSHTVSGNYSTAESQALPSANSTIASTPDSAFFLCFKITNRIFNESLTDQSSEDYEELRSELTRLLDDVYTSEPYNYTGVSAMAFRNGSVVADTTIVFRTAEINLSVVTDLFLDYAKRNPPLNLELNITEVQEMPLPDVGNQGNGVTSATTLTSSPHFNTATETTGNDKSTPSSGITNTKTTVSETPPFTQTVGSTPATTLFHSTPLPNYTTISYLTGSISSAAHTANSPSDNAAVTSKGTTKSPSSESTRSQLTHDTKDSTATSHSLRSSPVNPVTNISISNSSGASTGNVSFTSDSTTNDSLSETSSPHINSGMYSSSGPTVHPPVSSTAMTTVISSSHDTTIDFTEITNATSVSVTQSPPLLSTTDHPNDGTPNTPESSTVKSAMTLTPHGASPRPDPGTTAERASSRPASTAGTSGPPKVTHGHTASTAATPSTARPGSANAGAAPDHAAAASGAAAAADEQRVPSWAVTLLALASVILIFLVLLVVALLVYWCCKRRQYDFMNMSEDPGIYDQINRGADIPMYTTHSRFESPNGKPCEEREKPVKTRATYTVNQR